VAEQPKGNAPIASGTAAAAAAAGTATIGIVAGGGETQDDGKTGEPESSVVKTTPTAPVNTTPVNTGPANGGTQSGTLVPADAGKVDAAEGWGNPLLTLTFCGLFLATIVLAAWFFRKTSHA
jgi:hypothetical protein